MVSNVSRGPREIDIDVIFGQEPLCYFIIRRVSRRLERRVTVCVSVVLRLPSSDAETHSIHTANESSPDREFTMAENPSPSDSRRSQPSQRPAGTVGSQEASTEQTVQHGPRSSARLAGAHLPPDPSISTSPRRSTRLNSTQRR